MEQQTMYRALLSCLLLIAIGCAMRPTGYVAANASYATYGYSDSAEGGDDYSILVKANSATSDERVAQLALLRAARLTLEKGGNRFQIIHSKALQAQTDITTAVPLGGGGFIPITVGSDENKLAALVIHVLRPDATPVGPAAIDAQRVVADLGAKLQR
jgi:hypothetical protein